MKKKYKLTNKTMGLIKGDGSKVILYRIRALKDFGFINKGDLGGWVESEENLSQEGNCWIYNDAKVYNNARVFGNVIVFDNATISDNAIIHGNATVCNNAKVFGNAKVYGNVIVFDNAIVCDNAKVYDDAKVFGNCYVCDDATVFGNAKVFGNATVYGNAKVYGNVNIFGNSLLSDDSNIYNNAIVKDSKVSGSSKIAENSIVENSEIDCSYISGQVYNAKIKDTIVLATTIINGYKDIVPIIDDDRKFMTIGSINYTTEDGTNLTCLTAYYYDENIYYSFCIGKAHLCFKDKDELKDYLKTELIYSYETNDILCIIKSLEELLHQRLIREYSNDK